MEATKPPEIYDPDESLGYLVALETNGGWAAAIEEYGSAAVLDKLRDEWGCKLPAGSAKRVVALCGHHHRSPEACGRCFPKMKRHKRELYK